MDIILQWIESHEGLTEKEIKIHLLKVFEKKIESQLNELFKAGKIYLTKEGKYKLVKI